MKLEDLYKQTTSPLFEVLRSDGTPSGHRIKLKPVFSDDATLAQMRYNRVLMATEEAFEKENEALRDECEKAKNFTEYNYRHEMAVKDVKKAFAMELVEGWDFDNKFTEKALKAALDAFEKPLALSLSNQIINALTNAILEHAKK